MIAVTAAAAKARQQPAAIKATGMSSPNCGLTVSRPAAIPARIGRLDGKAPDAMIKVAVKNPFWPVMTP